MALGWRREYLRYKEFFLNILAVYKRRQDLKMFLEILLSLTTISFFTVFALRPTVLTISQLIKDVRSKSETVAKMDQKIQDLGEAQAVFEAESRIPLVETSVPKSPIPEGFVRQVEGLATTKNVSVLGISIGELTLLGEEKQKRSSSELSPLPEGAKGVLFSISISGNYPSLISFVEDLENLRRPTRVDSVGINASETETGKILVLVVSGRTPYLGGEERTNE